jgi:hypothetical protein
MDAVFTAKRIIFIWFIYELKSNADSLVTETSFYIEFKTMD